MKHLSTDDLGLVPSSLAAWGRQYVHCQSNHGTSSSTPAERRIVRWTTLDGLGGAGIIPNNAHHLSVLGNAYDMAQATRLTAEHDLYLTSVKVRQRCGEDIDKQAAEEDVLVRQNRHWHGETARLRCDGISMSPSLQPATEILLASALESWRLGAQLQWHSLSARRCTTFHARLTVRTLRVLSHRTIVSRPRLGICNEQEICK